VSLASRIGRRHRRHEEAELNITAFMNLMVVLVPFLLITAVFSRLTILELNLPSSTEATPETAQVLNLEIVVREGALDVADRGTGRLRLIPNTPEGPDLAALARFLAEEVKPRFPDATSATLLLEPDVAYDTLVQVMDAVRVTTTVADGRQVQAELFPDISIGDAPVVAEARR
jgi:biopolymer transport protein ExbD